MTKKHAIIVEDNKEIGNIYIMTLQLAEYETERYVDGRDALTRLQQTVPDLVVLDMNLPQVSGHYIYKKIRSDPRLANTRVIISTANNIVANALAQDLNPLDHLLIKPVSAKQLREIAESISKTLPEKKTPD
jgi:two-component system phosphate regulon response regulator PhoB